MPKQTVNCLFSRVLQTDFCQCVQYKLFIGRDSIGHVCYSGRRIERTFVGHLRRRWKMFDISTKIILCGYNLGSFELISDSHLIQLLYIAKFSHTYARHAFITDANLAHVDNSILRRFALVTSRFIECFWWMCRHSVTSGDIATTTDDCLREENRNWFHMIEYKASNVIS